MLDNLPVINVMSPTATTTTMPTMATMEILADAKVEATSSTTTTVSIKKKIKEDELQPYKTTNNKTKTILNWLKNTSNNNNNNTAATPKTIINLKQTNCLEIDPCQQQSFDSRNQLDKPVKATTTTTQQLATSRNCACSSTTNSPVNVNASDACTCRLLKQKTNTYHSHSPPLITADETLREFRGVQTLRHFWNKRITANKESALRSKSSKHPDLFTKSQSCLVSTSNQTGEPPPGEEGTDSAGSFLKHKLRARSLHDCSQDYEELSTLDDIEIQKHLEKDNFYKYKTAEQALKLRQLSEHSAAKRFSAGIILPLVQGFHKGERWFTKRKASAASSPHSTFKKQDADMPSQSDIVINDNPRPSSDVSQLPRASCQSLGSESDSSPTLTAANSPKRRRHMCKASPRRKQSKREDPQKVNNDPNATVSRNSSSTSLAHSLGGGSGSNGNLRSASVKRNPTSRKYSFKTHARSYHNARKMHTQKDNGSPVVPSNSLVAKLTQQFNEIIQHDKSLLEEVKRKNGVLMTHKGHVYKVVETGKSMTTNSLSRTSSKSHNLSESGDSSRDPKEFSDIPSSAVQKTIKKFETVSRNSNKPKVPSKSLKVLKKSNEVVTNKAGKVIYPPKAIMGNSKDSECRSPPNSLCLPKTLEMVKEEAKTPVESNTELGINEIENTKDPPVSEKENYIARKTKESKDIFQESSMMDKENQRNLHESRENNVAGENLPQNERIYGNNEVSIIKIESSGKSFASIKEKELSLLKQQRDSFFEEIIKDPKKNEDDLMDYMSIAKKRNITRCSSIIVDDPKKNLLIYINDKAEKRLSQTSQIYSGSILSTNSDDSSARSLQTKERLYTRPAPKLDLTKELTRELNEKLYNHSKFIEKTNDSLDERKELQIEECKEVDESFKGEEDGNSKKSLYDSKDNRMEMAAKLTKELKEKTNKEKLKENEKDEKSTQEDETYYEIKLPPETLESKKPKNRHSKFYEKIKFFTMSRKTSKPHHTQEISKSEDNVNLSQSQQSIASDPLPYIDMNPSPAQKIESSSVLYSPMYEPESKLLDALHQVDEKLQNLGSPQENKSQPPVPPLLVEADEYGHHIKPNSSFLHQNYSKDLSNKPATLIQAVNVTLVNAIEGEQMIMEQKEIQQTDTENETQKPEDLSKTEIGIRNSPILEEEPHYEPIGFIHLEQKETLTLKTESTLENSEINRTSESIEDDIYQTVEEVIVKRIYETSLSLKEDKLPSNPPTPPERILADYEVIQESNNHNLTLNCHLSITKNFDGYEEYSPSPLDSSAVSASINNANTTSSSSSPGVRKTTDELPDLPKPKRILPKSPMPKRTPTNYRPVSAPLESPANVTHSEVTHYYGGEEEEEDIYDTIRGSHCYESLQSVGNKLQKSASECTKSISDCVSINSNCYESISHFKPFRGVTSHHSGSSSHGSNLTLSSENKSNSLYEDSLVSNLHSFSSKRIYRSNTESQIDLQPQRNKDVRGSSSTYNASMGRANDTSDEWTDVTDNEQEDGEGDEAKPQFIIVRSKAHKSPDWSRRVRDKRLHHQRKSKSFIEDDDPDHYYEQLSPNALNKRHSLGTQQRTARLQRNQDAVRVSKRGKQISYSAHALGQEISDDSFDSDTDDYYESEQLKNSHNDSGVDIRTSKLPDPPASSNQMYAFVKKFKNFIGGSKKSPNSSKHGGSQQKIDDTSSQFYVSGNIYTPGASVGTGSGGASPSEGRSSLQVPQTKELSTSEKNLILAQSNVTKAEQLTTSTTPRKLKSGKSLRSRLRKSLVGFDSKQLQTLTPTRSTFYVEEPSNPEDLNNQMDSGFSEKASSGDIPNNTSTNTNNSSSVTSGTDTQKFTTLVRKSKKESKSSSAQRRKTTIGIRPIEPPPPPPDNSGGIRRQSNTSWYAECGVFKNGTTNLVTDDTQLLNAQNGTVNLGSSGASWYEEAGLYQTSGISVASSSGSSGVSTSNEASPADDMSHSMFSNEPLYQIYSAAKLEAISRDMHDEGSTDGYEEVGERRRSIIGEGERQRKSARQTALELVEKERGPARTLWSQIPEVVNSMILPTMTPRERALMEAKFEVITSEASYLKSLNLLRNHFMNHPVFRDQNIVNSRDRKALFAHIVPVHDCSERLLTELESCWQDNIMLIGLSKRIYAIAEKYFHVYVTFCEHQGRMDRTLKRLRSAKGLFSQNLELLESSDTCCGLNLHSFLMLPMQRITRLPLLIDAVFSKCDPNDDEYDNWKMCLAIINKIVTQCNEAATKSDQAFEIEKISRQLEFNPSIIRPLAIAPAGVLAPGTKPRFLVKKGEFTHLIWRGDDAKLTFGKKFTKSSIYAFLFSDLLVLTKRKGEEQFSVFDYCPRNMLTITSGETLPQLPTKDLNSQTSKNLILMTLLENHERKTNELLLSCPSVSEQERWLQAMRPPESETPGEKLYEQWDCPQVMANHAYENNEPDGLSLEVGDVVNVTRKLPDGWYQGERIRDGAIGWFPGSYTEEVNSAHVRARNLKLRHRLLTFTATYLESQKRNK